MPFYQVEDKVICEPDYMVATNITVVVVEILYVHIYATLQLVIYF